MDNSLIKGRYSLSTSNLTSPIAESTCLNGVSSRSKFNWGEGSMSSRSRNNSQSIVEQKNSTSKNSLPAKVLMSPSSRIDPRTYVDIHSNGLASRIVKYHDNSARLNRSMSMTNLYNKPGQFPVVHLKKPEQQYRAKKTKNLSMTRIAAPEKSAFHGNTLSSILRSGSIVGLQKSDEEISRENRPILHPPPTENEMAPTRSVLEVLKEISRKRINSDEMDGTEITKKQCKEPDQDSSSNISQRTQSKRQREITNSSTFNAQISPEQQVIKKRMCNYNNDILSSLSSSMASVNKKKMLEMQSQKRTASDAVGLNGSSASPSDPDQSRSRKERCIGNFESQQYTTKCAQVTPLMSAPIQNNDLDGNNRGGVLNRRASEPALAATKPKLTLFNKDYDEVPIVNVDNNTETNEHGDLCGIQFVKPKKSSCISSGGSLLIEKTKKSKLALMLSGLKGELDEEDEVDGVVPKEIQNKTDNVPASSPITSVSNITSSSSLFSTQTTTSVISNAIVTSKEISKDLTAKSAESTSGFKLNSVAISPNTPTTSISFQSNPTPVSFTTLTTQAQTSLQTITTSIPILSTTSTTASNSLVVPILSTTSTTASNPIAAPTVSTTSNPVIGGFSFGLLSTPKTATTITTTTASHLTSSTILQPLTSTATTSSVPTIPTSIAAAKPFAFGESTTQASTSTLPFSFGTTTTQAQTVPSTKESSINNTFGSSTKLADSTPSVFGQSSNTSQPTFTFGPLAAAKTNALTTELALPAAITNSLTSNFGSQKNTWSSQSTPTPANTNSIAGIGTFGTGNLSTLPQSTTTLNSTTSTGGFSFASVPTTEPAKSLFGNVEPTYTTSSSSNTTFSFSAAKPSANPTNAINSFTFGAGASSSPATLSNKPLAFGATAAPAVTNANPLNMFSSTANAKTSNAFAFGSSTAVQSTQNSAFPFSSSDKTTAAISTPSNSVGGFSFNNPSATFVPVPESNKNIFGSVAPSAVDSKPAFNFGTSSTTNPSTDKPAVFGNTTNIFGAPAASATPKSSAFTFGSTSSEVTNQGPTAQNPFGSTPASNITSLVPGATGSTSIFGAPSPAVPILQQTSTFSFSGNSTSIKQEPSKPAGGFVFGGTSSIASNAPKPAVDMNKTFVFGDNTTNKPSLPSSTPNVFGGSSTISGATENKVFSFGAPANGINNNTFGSTAQTVNPPPAFNFGAVAQANNVASANNVVQAPRPYKKATRRLHKT